MKMITNDERIERLGKYFVHFNLQEKGYTFERFIQLVQSGQWEKYNMRGQMLNEYEGFRIYISSYRGNN